MQDTQTAPAPDGHKDVLFGVCESLGEDFGFNPLWLRLAFAVALIFNPVAVLGAYAALGAVVALTRWVAPDPRRTAAARPEAEPAAMTVDTERAPLPLAA